MPVQRIEHICRGRRLVGFPAGEAARQAAFRLGASGPIKRMLEGKRAGMRRFVFPLESLLRLREREEERARAEFAQARRQTEAAERVLLGLRGLRRRAEEQIRQAASEGRIELLGGLAARLEALVGEERKAEARLGQARQAELAAHARLVRMTREAEVVRKLRERQQREFWLMQRRAEERADDELSTMRYRRAA